MEGHGCTWTGCFYTLQGISSKEKYGESTTPNFLLRKFMSGLLLSLFKPSKQWSWWRHFQDVLIKTNIFVLVMRLQNVFETFSRRLQDVFRAFCQSVFKTRRQDVFKTSLIRLAKMFSRHLQAVSKTYHQVNSFLLTRLQDVFKTYSTRFSDILQRRLSTERFV